VTRIFEARGFGESGKMDAVNIQRQLEQALGRPFKSEQVELLLAHLRYVIEQNNYLNLTRIADEEQGILLHIEDSLTALPELEAAPAGALADLGSGAGFPGIPLAIMSDRDCTLVEKTQKKARVIQGFIKDSALAERVVAEALHTEELAKQQAGQFAVVVARALSSLPSLIELAAPLLQPDGILVAYKGDLTSEELERGRRLERELGMTITGSRSFVLSDGLSKRTLVCIQKTGQAQRPLPRRPGQAQRHPLA
jgi:16S rRNA (guanine527-N7)-methyltransferase